MLTKFYCTKKENKENRKIFFTLKEAKKDQIIIFDSLEKVKKHLKSLKINSTTWIKEKGVFVAGIKVRIDENSKEDVKLDFYEIKKETQKKSPEKETIKIKETIEVKENIDSELIKCKGCKNNEVQKNKELCKECENKSLITKKVCLNCKTESEKEKCYSCIEQELKTLKNKNIYQKTLNPHYCCCGLNHEEKQERKKEIIWTKLNYVLWISFWFLVLLFVIGVIVLIKFTNWL